MFLDLSLHSGGISHCGNETNLNADRIASFQGLFQLLLVLDFGFGIVRVESI